MLVLQSLRTKLSRQYWILSGSLYFSVKCLLCWKYSPLLAPVPHNSSLSSPILTHRDLLASSKVTKPQRPRSRPLPSSSSGSTLIECCVDPDSTRANDYVVLQTIYARKFGPGCWTCIEDRGIDLRSLPRLWLWQDAERCWDGSW